MQPGGHQQRQRLALAAREAADGVVEPVLEAHAEASHALAHARRGRRRAAPSPSPRRRPRRAARARFSAIDMSGAVPLNGFWKTRPISLARRCSGQRVTSWPAMRIAAGVGEERAGDGVEQRRLSRAVGADDDDERAVVDASGRHLASARTSLGVPALNVLATALRPQAWRRLPAAAAGCRAGSGSTSAANTKTAVISLRSLGLRPARSAMATSSRNSTEPITAPMITSPSCVRADQRLADDDARQPPDHHADAHLHVGEALVLREQRAGQRDQAVARAPARGSIMLPTLTPSARIICGVVAGGAHGGAQVGAEEGVEQRTTDDRDHARRAAARAASRAATSQPQQVDAWRAAEDARRRAARRRVAKRRGRRAAARCSCP